MTERTDGDPGVESNSRLTAATGALLFVVLAAEGFTIVSIGSLLRPHVFIGALLVPPVLLKIGSTGYRFARYYSGAPPYVRKGPPPWILRVLGPAVVALTLEVLASGIALLYAGPAWRGRLLTLHKAGFILWFLVMAVHVLGHLPETVRVAGRDWVARVRRRAGVEPGGGLVRRLAVLASVGAGVALGVLLTGQVATYLGWVGHPLGG
ncbi:MAG TPA: hypothetical protein VFP54_03180 [Acidimicrobiales bacterium]|nr:hypothetical protein [Acidimicrobiales bacterium]